MDYKDLDQWIVDLDALQQELRTVNPYVNAVHKESTNYCGPQEHSVEQTVTKYSRTCDLSELPVINNATADRIESRHQFVRSGQPTTAKNNSKNDQSSRSNNNNGILSFSNPESSRRESYSMKQPVNSFAIDQYRSLSDEYGPIGNGNALRYAKQLATTVGQRNGLDLHHSSVYRNGPPKEQKSVHWSSELNSSPNTSMRNGTISTNPEVNRVSKKPSGLVELPTQIQKRCSPQIENHREINKPILTDRPHEKHMITSSAPPRSDVIVKRSHSIIPFEWKKDRSIKTSSSFAFPLTLADLADKPPLCQSTAHNNAHLDRTPSKMSSATSLTTFPIGHTSIPISVPGNIIRQSGSDTQALGQKQQLNGTDSSGNLALSRRGVIRSQSAVDYSLNDPRSPATGANSCTSDYGYPFSQHNSVPIQSPITVIDESRASHNRNTSHRGLTSQLQSNGTAKDSHDRLILRVYHPNQTTKAVAVGENTTAVMVIDTLLATSNILWSTKFALVQKIPSLKLERVFEDDELIITCLGNWTVSCENLIFLEEREDIYGPLENPQLWFGDANASSDVHNDGSVVKKLIDRNNNRELPLISEYLYIRTNESNWKRRFCLLQSSCLYMSKQKSKNISSFQPIVALKPFLHLYTATGGWSKLHAPTPYGFTLRPCSSRTSDVPSTVHFCAMNENSLRNWYSIIRVVLIGENMLKNYAYRKKLAESEVTSANKTLSLFSNNLSFDYDNIGDNRDTELSATPANESNTFTDHTHGPRSTFCVTQSKLNNASSTNTTQTPAHSPDADVTGADAGSIRWSTNDSGCGAASIVTMDTETDLGGGVGADKHLRHASVRKDMRSAPFSHSTTDLERASDLGQRHTSCANSLTSLFSCTVGDKKGNTAGSPSEPTKKNARSIKKRFFGFGPSARRCSRSVTHISAPFNVSVPNWVRSSMNDLSRSASMSNSVR